VWGANKCREKNKKYTEVHRTLVYLQRTTKITKSDKLNAGSKKLDL